MLLEAIIALAATGGGLALFTGWTAGRVEKALPPRGRFMDVRGNRLHYLDDGAGPDDDRPAVVMVHGLGGQMHHFTHSLLGLRCFWPVSPLNPLGLGSICNLFISCS